MNWQQLSAVIQLRWQISRNQWRRGGAFNAVLMSILAALVLFTSVMAFFGAVIGGYLLLPEATPDHLLILWDVVALGFLFVWMFGLMMELQRSEMLSLDKLLHLPVSLFGAFLLNYLSSLASMSLAVFLPLAIGLNIALVATHGPAMLLVLPLIFGFVLMITGVTYQFRGWLARLMENKRRRGSVLAIITIVFVLLMQLPNLINLSFMRTSHRATQQHHEQRLRQFEELREQLKSGQLTAQEFTRRTEEVNAAHQSARDDGMKAALEQGMHWLRFANMILPIGWLAFGAQALAQGNVVPALLGSIGMFAIGMLSLRRSYLGTMKAYTRVDAKPAKGVVATADTTPVKQRTLFVARRLPLIPGEVSAVGLMSLVSVIRSPEGKMMLLSPLIFLGMFAAFLILGPAEKLPAEFVPPLAILSIGMTLLSVIQLQFNAFGFDRSGFRAYILMPVDRHDVLFGKNLSLLPLALGLNGLFLVALFLALPLPISHVPATLIQATIAFLLMCLVGNLVSIYAPITLPTGSLRPQTVNAWPMLLQFLGMLLIPVAMLPAAAACGIEYLLEYLTGFRWVPWYLLLSAAEAGLIVLIYFWCVREQGKLLQRRETRILEIIAVANE